MAKFRIASTPRFRDKTGEWKDGDSLFLTVNVWRQAAENVAESMTRGTRAIVTGRLRQRSYETKEGEKRTVYELEADEVGPSPPERHGEGHQGHPRQRGRGPGSPQATGKDADPWASDARRVLGRTSVLTSSNRAVPVLSDPHGSCHAGLSAAIRYGVPYSAGYRLQEIHPRSRPGKTRR